MPTLLCVALTLLAFAASAKDILSSFNSLPPFNNIIDAQVSTKEITYAVATRKSPKLDHFVTPIDASKINKNKPVIVIIHGWTNNGQKPWIQNLTRVLLKRSDCNVISVDWKKPANGSYSATVSKTKPVGEIVGDAIVGLVKKNKIPLKNFHVIGGSMGAHAAGFAGQRVKSKLGKLLPWITGLDPAGPLYEVPVKLPKNQRLSDDDGQVVEVIHTDGGILGFHSSIGTIDFFPNGGLFIQPNCSSTVSKNWENYIYCSHEKSNQYYTKALSKHGYTAVKCSSWIAYKNGGCKKGAHATFGDLKPPKQKGNFYLEITGPVLNVV